MMTLSRNHMALACLSATLLLAGCKEPGRIGAKKKETPAQTADSWSPLTQNDNLRAAEQAYRACAHEAALHNLPIEDFPEVSERVTYLTQDGKRLRKFERVDVNVDDMRINNGCSTHIIRSVSIDVMSSAERAMRIDESGRTRQVMQAAPASDPGAARLQLALAKKNLPAPTCSFMRDPGLQSHFMMLNLCRYEERRAEQKQQRRQRQPEPGQPKHAVLPATTS